MEECCSQLKAMKYLFTFLTTGLQAWSLSLTNTFTPTSSRTLLIPCLPTKCINNLHSILKLVSPDPCFKIIYPPIWASMPYLLPTQLNLPGPPTALLMTRLMENTSDLVWEMNFQLTGWKILWHLTLLLGHFNNSLKKLKLLLLNLRSCNGETFLLPANLSEHSREWEKIKEINFWLKSLSISKLPWILITSTPDLESIPEKSKLTIFWTNSIKILLMLISMNNLFKNLPLPRDTTNFLINLTLITKFLDSISVQPILNAMPKLSNLWLFNVAKLMTNLPDISNIYTNSVECIPTGEMSHLNAEIKFIL